LTVKCPLDTDIDLVMTDRSGVEIDYCPKCRGVWLDRGELDKLIERAAGPAPAAPPAAPAAAAPQPGIAPPPPRRLGSSPDSYDTYGTYGKKKRSSLLKEIFDF
jgi:Zn-finger nucleic acid-binding protein